MDWFVIKTVQRNRYVPNNFFSSIFILPMISNENHQRPLLSTCWNRFKHSNRSHRIQRSVCEKICKSIRGMSASFYDSKSKLLIKIEKFAFLRMKNHLKIHLQLMNVVRFVPMEPTEHFSVMRNSKISFCVAFYLKKLWFHWKDSSADVIVSRHMLKGEHLLRNTNLFQNR